MCVLFDYNLREDIFVSVLFIDVLQYEVPTKKENLFMNIFLREKIRSRRYDCRGYDTRIDAGEIVNRCSSLHTINQEATLLPSVCVSECLLVYFSNRTYFCTLLRGFYADFISRS